MPAKKAHIITGLVLGFITGFIIYDNIFYVLIFTLLSGATADLPDLIERPTNSLHRKFFHSITLFTILIIMLLSIISNPVSGLIFGYLTHLLLDFARTKHKPLI